VVKYLNDNGFNVVAYETCAPDELDFRIPIKRLEELFHPDYYVMFIFSPGTANFIKQFYEITGKKNLAAIAVFQEMSRDLWPLANGLWYIDNSSPGLQNFYNKLHEITGTDATTCTWNN
jgi:hypothetical protein